MKLQRRQPLPGQLRPHFRRIEAALSRASTPSQLRRIQGQVDAFRNLLKAARAGLAAENEAAALRVRIEPRIGLQLRALERQRGGSKARRAPLRDTLGEFGISKRTAHRYELLAMIDEEEFEGYLEELKATAREVTTAAVLRKFKPIPHDPRQTWLWPDWPEICQALQQARLAYYTAFAQRPGCVSAGSGT